MGKRRSRKAPPKKAVQKLPSTFDCPFCNHMSTVQVKLVQSSKIGKLDCRVCGVKSETTITHLSKEIDVYCEWMDSCVELNKQGDDPEHILDDEDFGISQSKKQRITDEGVAALLEPDGSDGSVYDPSQDPYQEGLIASDDGLA
eukprot:TRINITY_DN2694_c0_g1_i1.p1 TRINITY_DN2694_c0_g1~~TRINITY_DN2694_c0_g1_i1.p1  ORF type:complete len:153 (+),score=25.81 TRINITY_DN2694_c0_g1_i1:29-460(+)